MKFGLKPEIITLIQNIFSHHPEVEEVILYGSRAKGNYRIGSDIDLTIKGEKLNLTRLNQIANEIDDLLLPYSFDLSLFAEIQNQELIDHINRVGQNFYQKNF